MFKSINPTTQETLGEYPVLETDEINRSIQSANKAFEVWRRLPVAKRASLIDALGQALKREKRALARIITLEMGKPLAQAEAEINKCAWLCEYYSDKGPEFLEPEMIDTDARKSYVRFDPLGLIMGIMPWNFPCWQAFRFAIPTILAGNVVFLKPAPNVPQVSRKIESLIAEVIGIEHVFQTAFIDVQDINKVIDHPFLRGVALTGSDKAGSSVASLAGKAIKKCVLELGGSDPFIVLEDADLDRAAKIGAKSRMNNTGQTCIAAKRFIVHSDVYENFMERLTQEIKQMKLGDPTETGVDLGPLSRPDILETLNDQVVTSVRRGAEVRLEGGPLDGKGNFYRPCILENIRPGMPVFEEEVFGPVALLFEARDHDLIIEIANNTPYGLGASIWTEDLTKAERLGSQIQAGAIAINDMVKSDPRMPFGGVKRSGHGRELGKEGIREFVNIKSISIGKN